MHPVGIVLLSFLCARKWQLVKGNNFNPKSIPKSLALTNIFGSVLNSDSLRLSFLLPSSLIMKVCLSGVGGMSSWCNS